MLDEFERGGAYMKMNHPASRRESRLMNIETKIINVSVDNLSFSINFSIWYNSLKLNIQHYHSP
jgi:hypothetical protein